MSEELTPKLVRRVKQERKDDLQRDYITIAVAQQLTGMSPKKLLQFCAEQNVRHVKHMNKWHIHRQELAQAFQKT